MEYFGTFMNLFKDVEKQTFKIEFIFAFTNRHFNLVNVRIN